MAWQAQWIAAKEFTVKQVQALMLCFSHDTLAIIQNLRLTEEKEDKSYDYFLIS